MQTVKKLLDAEEEAKRTIEQARAERDARLKQAAAEADSQIAKFKADKEAEYQHELSKYDSSSGSASVRIRDDAEREIKSAKYSAQENKDAVVDMLYNFVTSVNVDA